MDTASTYAGWFFAARPAGTQTPEQAVRVGAALVRVVEAAKETWPTVRVPVEPFLRRLAGVIPKGSEADPAEVLPRLHTSDLYLATGCLLHLPAAFTAFEAAHFKQIDAIARRMAPSEMPADEIRQLLREKLFLGTGENAALAKYSAQGALPMWLRVLTTRLILNAATRGPRDRPAAEEDAAVLDRVDAKEGVELAYMRSLFDNQVRQVMPEAFATLSAHERLLVRQRYLDGLSLEQLSALHDVHLATIKRQLAAVREKLSRALKDLLTRRFEVPPAELTSLLRLVQSRFQITVRRLLGDPKAAD